MTESIEDSSSNNDETLIDNDDELKQFTKTLDEFTPVIPETVTKYYMKQCGLQSEDERVVKLLSVSVQKFMSGIINDCYQLHKLREKSTTKPNTQTTAASAAAAAAAQPTTTEANASATTTNNTDQSGVKKPVVSTNQTLTLNDLTHVLGEYGINVKKTFYYT